MERFAGRFERMRLLGRGGMGAVWLARDLADGSECVLKQLDPAAVRMAPDSLRREFELLARVRHPAVVAVRDMGFAPDGTPWLSMEYVPGVAADHAEREWDVEALCFVGSQVASGLEALHAAGVVHGDLKPSNLLLLPPREGSRLPSGVRLVDFRLAALLGRDREGHRGTPGFAAPEVVRGEAPSVASDLYGLPGAMLYTLGARRLARDPVAAANVMRRQQHASPPAAALEEAGLPGPLVQLVLRLLSPVAAERPADAHEVRRDLARIHPAASRTLAERLAAESLVGRERELGRFERWLRPAATGARITFVTGEPGAGKTALLRELEVRATLAGCTVVRLACRSAEAVGAPMLALLRRLAVEEAVTAAEAQGGAALAAALAADRDALEFGAERIAESAATWLAALASAGRPVVALFDDCERMDGTSRALLRAIALDTRAESARWVCAGRGTAAGLREDERTLLAAGHASAVALGPLDHEGVERLVAARLQATPPEGLCEFLHRRTSGLPGLLVETLRAAAEAGAIRDAEAGMRMDPGAFDRLGLPANFEASLLDRLGALPAGARAAAEALATLDRPARLEELALLDPRVDAAALEALVASGLAVADASGGFGLQPPALARGLLAGLPAERCRRLHSEALGIAGDTAEARARHLEGAGRLRDALTALEAALAVREDEVLAVRGATLAEQVDPASAAAWHERAGRALLDRGRHREAAGHLERSLDSTADAAARPVRWRLLTSALLRSDRPADVERAVERALVEDPPARERALLLVNRGAHFHALGRLDEAEASTHEALRLAEDAADDEAIGYAEMTLGSCRLARGDHAGADAHAYTAMTSFDRAGRASGAVRAVLLRAQSAQARQDRDGAEALLVAALERARRDRLRLATEEILLALGVHSVEVGRWKEAEASFDEGARLALQDGRPRGAAVATANLALLDALTGRVARARRRARRGVRLLRAHLPRLEAFGWRALAIAESVGGRAGAAERAARRATGAALRVGNAFEGEWTRWCYGRIRSIAGAWNEADGVWRSALEQIGDHESAGRQMLLICSGRAALRRRELDVARDAAARVERWLETARAPWVAAHLRHLQAELLLAQGRTEDGVEAVRRTLAAFAALPCPADQALAALDCARVAIAAGLTAPVDEWLEQAAATFERLGDHRGRERALALAFEWLRAARLSPTRTRSRDLLRAVSRLLDSLSELGELTRRAMALAVEQLDAERGVLLLVDERTGALMPVVELGAVDAATRDQAMTYSREVVARVAATGGSLLIPDAASDPGGLSASMVDLRLRSIVCVPLYGAGQVVGAVYLDDSRRSEAFSDADRALLEGFAHLVAIAIAKNRGEEEQRRSHERLELENRSLRQVVSTRFQPQNFVGVSSPMQKVMAVAERAAQTNTTVLITGENGTGKEMVARVIHYAGRRRLGPFVSVNCGAIPETLLESELFGILPNVATGVRGRDGRFVQANGGTLFLDEIGDMPLAQQVALLSALSSREVTPIGGGAPIAVDVRIIAATNQDLRQKIESGTFREDLYYRLNVLPIEVPPLRERKADVPALAHHFVVHFARQQEREAPALSPEFLAALMQSDWPGNVRELQNYVERVMAMTPGRVLLPNPLPRDLSGRTVRPRPLRGRKLSDALAEVERQHIQDALERSGGNQSRAARELGLTEQTLRYRMRKIGTGVRKNRRAR
ncbi:MAG: sigma 54-interacting transcriptional regulator [Candidatus Eisenbacteria bacterium]